jgi:predicted NUDIX family NTP pyrophosphohydrolase
MFEMEWPPRSGLRSFTELDRAAWSDLAEAQAKILKGQVVFLDDRLVEALVGRPVANTAESA